MKSIVFFWILRLAVAVILVQTLYFKFTGSEESVYIFSALGVEPYGRIGTGIAELIVAILILFPKTTWLGALGGCGVMSGAILSHLFVLGIAVENDGGLLFVLALIVLLSCIELINLSRSNFFNLLKAK